MPKTQKGLVEARVSFESGKVFALLTHTVPPCPAGVGVGVGQGALLTQTRMEKKEKVMAALALLLPRRKYLGGERCHWLARKQNPTAQVPAQMTGGSRERRGWGGGDSGLRKGRG